MHRDLIGRAPLFPDGLLRLDGDPELVFKTSAELLAHHAQISLDEAQQQLQQLPPEELMMLEIDRAYGERGDKAEMGGLEE
jgi:hypothetical protein